MSWQLFLGDYLMQSVKKVFVLACVLVFAGCSAQPFSAREKGALTGGVIGSGLGAIIGNQTGNTGAGIAIGAGAGAISGGLIGNSVDNVDARQSEQDERMRRQDEEIRRQQREIEELKRRGGDSNYDSRDSDPYREDDWNRQNRY